MKKVYLSVLILLVAFVILGCQQTTSTTTTTTTTTSSQTTTTTTTTIASDTDPVILGADDVTIQKNSAFVPLAGVTATDVEDGDLTSSITYQGNVNPNAVGTYTATYTVTDSDGNITIVNRTVTVVFTDTQVPLFSGVADKMIYVGEEINLLDGISATDTVDGSVPVTYTGTVDIWTPGEYEIVYSAEDESGNEATVTRTITVSFGDFVFGAEEAMTPGDFTVVEGVYSSPAFSGGVITPSIADFAYVRVTLSASSTTDGTVAVALGSLPSNLAEISVTSTDTEFVLYFVIEAALVDAVLTLDAGTLPLVISSVSVSFAEVRDMVAPVLHVPSDEAAYVVGYDQSGLEGLLRSGVTAVDDVDGNLTSTVTIDYGTLDLNVVGVYDVVYSVTDLGGNESTFTRSVIIGNLVDSGYVSDPNFQNEGDEQWNEKSNDGQASITYDDTEGTMIITVTSLGNYLSAAGGYLKESSLDLEVGQWYMFTFTVKTTIARTMGFRMGLVTDQTYGWVDDFDGRSDHQMSINSEYQTFSFFFMLDSLVSTNGSELFIIELNLGNLNYSNIGKDGVTTFKDVFMYKVVTTFEAPTYETNSSALLPVKFTVGDTAPNWLDYVSFKDMSNLEVIPTVDASAVDFNTPGTYDVIYTATDSHDMTTTYTLQIQVLSAENADVVGPVITIDPSVVTTIDQFTNISVSLKDLVTVIDAVDGEIEVTSAMVDDGGLDFNVAGVYTVTFTVYDLSGNVTILSVDVTILDKQVPSINVNPFTINVGDPFDGTFGLSVVDNVDGAIDIVNVTITGLDAFTTSGIATEEGTFEITYTVTDAAGNQATKTVAVEVLNLVWDETTRVALGDSEEAPTHSTVIYDAINEEYVISAIDVNVDPWDHARWVYYLNSGTELEFGKTYKLEITVKATEATDLYFRIGATLYVDPWIDNFTGGLRTISITSEYVTYQIVFTVDKEMVNGSAKLQFMYGYLSSDATNTIYVQSFDLVQEQEPDYIDVLTFQTPDEIYHTVGTLDFVDEAFEMGDIIVAAYDWDPARIVYYLDNTVLEMGKTYRIIFTAKADVATELRLRIGATLWVDPWIDNFTGGLKTIYLTDEYVNYQMIFTADKELVNGNAKFQFMFGYLSTDASNTVYVKDFKLQEVIAPHVLDAVVIDEFLYEDDTALEAEWTERSGGVNYTPSDRISMDADNNALIFSNLEAKTNGWNLIRKYDSLTSLGGTDEYKYLNFYIKNNTNVTAGYIWLYWSGSQNAYAVTLPAIGESGWVTLEITTSGHSVSEILDFAFGFDNWGAVSGGYSVYYVCLVKDVAELSYVELQTEAPVVEPLSIVIDDFTYLNEDAFEPNWTLRINGSNGQDPSPLLELDPVSHAMVFELPAVAPEGWFIARRYAALSTFSVTDDHRYLAFYMHNDTNVTSASVWLYWSGSQNAYTITLPAIGTTGWAYVDIAASSHTPTQITDFGIAFSDYSSNQVVGSLKIYSINVVKDPFDLFDVEVEIGYPPMVVFNDFEDYADNTAYQAITDDNIEGNRIGSGTFIKSNATLITDGDNNLLAQAVSPAVGTNGIKIRIVKAEIPQNINYIALWIKSTDVTNMVKFQSFIYTAAGGYLEITSTLVSDFAELGNGTYVYIPVSSLQDDTVIVSLVVNCNAGATGYLHFDNITLTEEFIVPENQAPVVSVSDANLEGIAALTLVAGTSIETLEAMLLSVIEINDQEDGVITPTVGMINYNGLNLTNPVMGSYTLEITATDSESLASSVYQLKISVVTILENYESFTDDADFKANYTDLLGFRVSGGSWSTASGALATVADNNVLQLTYGAGTNGIKIAMTKAELTAAGAEYVGIHIWTSAEITGITSVFQAFYYNPAGYTQVSTYGTISYTDAGTYVYIKVSDLPEDLTGISLMINLASGNSGTMYMDNLVIK